MQPHAACASATCGVTGLCESRRQVACGSGGAANAPCYAERVSTDPVSPPFDAIAAARELEDALEGAAPPVDAAIDEADYIAELEVQIEELSTRLAQRDEELRRATTRADRAHTEIEAVQRRVEAASARELEERTRKLLEGMLPVLDNLDRAFAAGRIAATSGTADLLAGIELVRREMLITLGRFGVSPVPARGEPFDPTRHEALALVPVDDAAQDNRVVDVMREGYAIGERTLRPAGVAVGRYSMTS